MKDQEKCIIRSKEKFPFKIASLPPPPTKKPSFPSVPKTSIPVRDDQIFRVSTAPEQRNLDIEIKMVPHKPPPPEEKFSNTLYIGRGNARTEVAKVVAHEKISLVFRKRWNMLTHRALSYVLRWKVIKMRYFIE
ncbi:hypothetical protein TNCV_3295631 [Trichonephila clavipes]|uniref:Uncharacterized protein n=1 Tax=Trichonephila clavipes TaxID=2585209 RepID=A0A8X6VPN6_TRICX|nr:hypothetical protein TNCV_3295631 [Trichonephila clavipes]